MKFQFVMAVVVVVLLSENTGKSFAQPCTLDQSLLLWNGGTSERILPGYYEWQSFTAGMTGTLCEIDLMLGNSNIKLNGTGTLKFIREQELVAACWQAKRLLLMELVIT